MKLCPQCEFIYEDDQTLCDMDGRELVYDRSPLACEELVFPTSPEFHNTAEIPVTALAFEETVPSSPQEIHDTYDPSRFVNEETFVSSPQEIHDTYDPSRFVSEETFVSGSQGIHDTL